MRWCAKSSLCRQLFKSVQKPGRINWKKRVLPVLDRLRTLCVLRQRMNADHYCAFMHRFQDSVTRLKHWLWMASFYFLFQKTPYKYYKIKTKGTQFGRKRGQKIDLHLYMFWTHVYSVIRLKHWLWMVSFYFLFRKLHRNTIKYRQREHNLKGKKVRK